MAFCALSVMSAPSGPSTALQLETQGKVQSQLTVSSFPSKPKARTAPLLERLDGLAPQHHQRGQADMQSSQAELGTNQQRATGTGR